MKIKSITNQEFKEHLDKLIDISIEEDIGSGDYTTMATVAENSKSTADLIAKEKGIIAGVELCEMIINKIDKTLSLELLKSDGDEIKVNEKVFTLTGRTSSILTSERLILNFIQHMSGIATKTRRFVNLVAGRDVTLKDTRKTTPGMRYAEKWAVKIGGASNHRTGLFDMILIKDNHIDQAGGIKHALDKARSFIKKNKLDLQVEIEGRNLIEVEEIIENGDIVDIVLLDNFETEEIKKAVGLIDGKFLTEASGGIDEANLKEYAATGVDFISTSELTRNFRGLDLSLKIRKK